MVPPERVRPCEEARPAVEIPPLKVEVAVEVFNMEPPVKVSPLEAARLAAEIPPVKVEVAAAVD